MTSGGARPHSGPASDPSSLRSAGKDWIVLPFDGYDGPTPAWPLLGQSDREAEVWEAQWRTPQATRWIAERLEWQVAVYVRRLVEAEEPKSAANLGTLVRQLADDLGLTKAGMLRNLWRIGGASESRPLASVPDDETADNVIELGSSRDRLRKGE